MPVPSRASRDKIRVAQNAIIRDVEHEVIQQSDCPLIENRPDTIGRLHNFGLPDLFQHLLDAGIRVNLDLNRGNRAIRHPAAARGAMGQNEQGHPGGGARAKDMKGAGSHAI